jgi:hypothetical protein
MGRLRRRRGSLIARRLRGGDGALHSAAGRSPQRRSSLAQSIDTDERDASRQRLIATGLLVMALSLFCSTFFNPQPDF